MMKKLNVIHSGRGAQLNTPNPFESIVRGLEVDAEARTEISFTRARSIVNRVDSPDIPFGYSLNPYQGCEHGCIYCYARTTHHYWGYSAGLDFESKILVKKNAVQLLEKKLRSKRWKATPVMMSGNTDPYQPVEKDLKITRSLLQIFLKYRHPVGIITKNALVKRDIDILTKLSRERLVHVAISLTTLDESLRRVLEPRTSTSERKLEAITALSDAGIPVHVMMAPVIPGLNNTEIFQLLRRAAQAGARSASYVLVRLNDEIGDLFKNWLMHHFPDRAEKVLHQIESIHGGQIGDKRFGTRMRGEGEIADIIKQQFALARSRYFKKSDTFRYNCELHEQYKDGQLSLFA